MEKRFVALRLKINSVISFSNWKSLYIKSMSGLNVSVLLLNKFFFLIFFEKNIQNFKEISEKIVEEVKS